MHFRFEKIDLETFVDELIILETLWEIGGGTQK